MFYNKGALRNFGKFTGKHPCQGLFFNKVAGRPEKEITKKAFNFVKKESLAQVLSCEFGKISKSTFCYKTHPVAASDRYSRLRSQKTFTCSKLTIEIVEKGTRYLQSKH